LRFLRVNSLERDPVPIVLEVRWAPEPFWTGAENLAPSGIQSPDFPARRESLWRLSYPGPSADLIATEHTAERFRSNASISQTPRSGMKGERRRCIAAVKKKKLQRTMEGGKERRKERKNNLKLFRQPQSPLNLNCASNS
jgi:hypothetical protein